MRPLRLSLQGFTCFKEDQTLDFSRLDLFAIVGPTGSGKTSLLDAMIFALYGGVPRIGQQGLGELISHGRDRLAVTLDFRVGDRVFRIVRVAHRRPVNNKALLEELRDGTATPITDGTKNVDSEVQRIVGMPYEVFTQAVVLPQGEFARFLHSAPSQRQKILRDLLRHQVYGLMQKLAGEKTRELEGVIKGMEERLAEDFGGATPEAENALHEELQAAKRRSEEQATTLAEVRTGFQEIRSRHGKTAELIGVLKELEALYKRLLQIDSAQQQIELARRAAGIVPFVEAARNAEATAEEEVKREAEAHKAAERARRAYNQTRRALDAAQGGASEIPALRDRITKLAELKGVVKARHDAGGRLKAAQLRAAKLSKMLQGAKRKAQEAEKLVRQLASQEHEAERSLRAIRYDADLDNILEKLREIATSLEASRKNLARMSKNANRLKKEAAGAQSQARRKAAQLDRARKTHAELAGVLREAEQALRKAEEEHAAVHLRSRLKRGERCPVCEQPVSIVPARIKVPRLDALQAREAQLKEEEGEALKTERDVTAELAALNAGAKRAAEEGAAAREDADQAAKEVTQLEKMIKQRAGNAVAKELGETIESKVLGAARRLAALRNRHAKSQTRLREARAKRERAELAFENARLDIDRLTGELKAINGEAQEVEGEVASLEAQIRAVTDHPDPEVERRKLDSRVETLEKQFKDVQDKEQRAKAGLAKADAEATQAKRAGERAVHDAQATLSKAQTAAKRVGFTDLQTLENATLPEEEIKQLEGEIDSYRARRNVLEQQRGELQKAVGGQQVTDAEMRAAEKRLGEAEVGHQEALKTVATFEQRLTDLRQRIERAEKIRVRLEAAKRQYAVYRQLADDLRAERFQSFLLDEAFRDLVAGASQRLYKLSDRYDLEYGADREFMVVDYDNAMERRSADTLSGGETFLASLALALELSEQVQRQATAVHLDSLFIDEGFGTLDRETLDGVAGAIEALQVGGRMVGIVTHIDELAARLPARVSVRRQPEGSRVVVDIA